MRPKINTTFLSGRADDGPFSEDGGDNRTRMGWFQAFRGDFGYSHYGEYRTSVTADIPFAAIIYTCVLISIASLIAAAGIRGKERWYTLARMVYSLTVGSIILVSIFGYCWQTGEVGVHSVYIYRRESYMEGTVGVRVGLKTVNLTLTGRIVDQGSSFSYNEELVLLDVIHKPPKLWGALERGLPQPLLSVLEHFDTDDGGLRFGRACWLAGYIANILLWTAFAFWVTGNILLCSIVWYGAACFTLTGVCMILAPVLYDTLCPQADLRMPCADDLLRLRYGWCFWSTLAIGIITTLAGLLLFTLDQKVPHKLAEFFLLDTALIEDADDTTPRLYPALSAPPSRPDTPDSKHLTMTSTPKHAKLTKGQANQSNVTCNGRINGQMVVHSGGNSGTQAEKQKDTPVHILDKRQPPNGIPVNWYDNFACDQPVSRGNPVYDETGYDDTPFDQTQAKTKTQTQTQPQSNGRVRTYSDIKEEVEQRNSVDVATETEEEGDEGEEHTDAEERAVTMIDRMNQIYVDVEPSYTVSTNSLNSSLRSQSPLPK